MEIKHYGELLSRKDDLGETLVSNEKMHFEYYHLRPEALMNVWFNPNDVLNDAQTHYFVMEGKLEARLPLKKLILEKGDLFSMYSQTPFNVYALEESVVLCVHNTDGEGIDDSYLELVEYVVQVEKKDRYIQGHNRRVSRYTGMIMHIVDPAYQGTNHIIAAMCHDIGKMKIDPEILNKPGKLSDEEFAEIKKHPVYSYEMIREKTTEEIARIARWHHEKPDGSGYPDGLRGEAIPLASRVIAVADVFDALTTSRSYRKAFPFAKALEIMEGDVARNQLDADAFAALKELVKKGMISEGVDNLFREDPTW